MPDETPKRITLTKAQRESQAGSDLLSICQRITADGRLTDVEIGELKLWLEQHRMTDLPATQFLAGIVEDILDDGRVTDGERFSLHQALERVMPADVRTAATEARREVGREIAKDEARSKARIVQLYSKVRGVTFSNRDGTERQPIIAECCAGDPLRLEREPSNPIDRNAIKILTSAGDQVGYVSARLAGSEGDRRIGWCLAKRMDEGIRIECRIKNITGGGALNQGVNIDLAFWDGPVDSQPPGPLLSAYEPESDGRPTKRSGCGCLPGCIGLIVSAALAGSLIAWVG